MPTVSKISFVLACLAVLVSCSSYQHATTAKKPAGTARIPDRKVIYNASMTIAVDNADTLNNRLIKLSEEYNGYAVTLGDKSSVVRVQSAHLEVAVKRVMTLGKVKHKTISGNDVTEEYKDYSIRLDNATQARLRYLELLAKAEDVESTLKVEKELERLNTEIETLKSKLEGLDHLSEFSTITLTIIEKEKPGIIGYAGIGVYKAVRWLFVRV